MIPTYQYTLAAAKVGKRQFEAAQVLLEGVLKTKESDPQLQYALGSVLYLQGHLTERRRICAKAFACSPSNLRPTIIWLWLPGIRATRPKPSEIWRIFSGAILITLRPVKLWAACL